MNVTSVGVLNALPSNYEYFTHGGIKSGLNDSLPRFQLNGKDIFIYSGAFHYFRTPRPYWRDRLRKMRAAGLNTVETFVPWNLHEPRSGEFDFGTGKNDMSDFLHLEEFLKTAKEEDLFAIVRPGPYIGGGWEFGGLPSWLLREDKIEMRTSDAVFMKYVTRFFNVLLPILAALQFIKGGPIIALQVENEYSLSGKHDSKYLMQLVKQITGHGLKTPLMTADRPREGTYGSIPSQFLLTGILDHQITDNLDMLNAMNGGKRPTMVMEFRTGQEDYWSLNHTERPKDFFAYNFEKALKYPASINVYMFVGGTNFAFMNGGKNTKKDDKNTDYYATTSSYDLMAPISESGELTDKYFAIKKLLEKYNPVKTRLPDIPQTSKKVAYPTVKLEQQLYLNDLLKLIKPISSKTVIPMEKLDINANNGQSYGYVVYRKIVDLPPRSELLIEGRVCDTVTLLVNGELKSPILMNVSNLDWYGTSKTMNSYRILNQDEELKRATIDIMIENWGRVNDGEYKGFKGLWQGQVRLNNAYIHDWLIYPLEFKQDFTSHLGNFHVANLTTVGPAMYRAHFNIAGSPQDTYVNMESWVKGIVMVNGFVVGRYAHFGPIQTLYIPATVLRKGENFIDIFEHFIPAKSIVFSDKPIYKTYE
ncbi:unnamed protein product [Callosobruchus maculatus]|uniref:Beta-galactosidase n=1 Tax=Callosobruchus maculatus TaxID=64391 RepID=A0A653BPZ3_CALMS|nr:unnamed protein product [Callosobruchus maculatus]